MAVQVTSPNKKDDPAMGAVTEVGMDYLKGQLNTGIKDTKKESKENPRDREKARLNSGGQTNYAGTGGSR